MASSMKTLVENITQQTDRIRKELDDGSLEAKGYNLISDIMHHCEAFIPIAENYWLHYKRNRSEALESLVAHGCDAAAARPFSTNDVVK